MSAFQRLKEGAGRLTTVLPAWLVEPVQAVRGNRRRREARLLSTLILSFFLLLVIIGAGYQSFVPGYRLPNVHWFGTVVWLGLYVLSRLGKTQLAVIILLALYPTMMMFNVVKGTVLDIASTLAYLIPSIVLAGLFLEPLATGLYGIGASVVMLLLPLIAPAVVHGYSQIIGPFGASVLTVALVVISIVHRDRIEQDHQSRLTGAYNSTLEGWARALEYRDKDTEGHSRRVAAMALRLASVCGLRGEELESVYRGALLHDIGKMALPDSILSKQGNLTAEEEQVMRTHTRVAVDLLSPTEFLRPAMDIPAYHHENWDGSGYPYGLRGEDIPLAARIFVVVDAWDALSSDRSYRKAWSRERVIQHLRQQSGIQFDPKVVKRFLGMIGQ